MSQWVYFFTILFSARLLACSCVGGITTCGSIASSKVAFIGTVIQGTEPGDGKEHRGFGASVAIVKVETIVKGLDKSAAEITVNPAVGTSCYFAMKPGECWLVLGQGGGEGVMTGGCSGSRQIPASDTAVERMVESFLHAPNLFIGEVRSYKGWDSPWRTDNLLGGVDVVLNSDGKQWPAKSDSHGRFELSGLPPGDYDLEVRSPGMTFEHREDAGIMGHGVSSKVTMAASGCVEAPLMLVPDQAIKGTVKSFDGKPVASIKVQALELNEQGRPSRSGTRAAITDTEGRYSLPRLMNAKYIVGVNAEWGTDESPYAARYYPSVDSAMAATSIAMEGKTREHIDITLDPPRDPVNVPVHVAFADGKPAGNAYVSIELGERGMLFTGMKDAEKRFTDAAGMLTLRLYRGGDYTLSARWMEMDAARRTSATAESDRVHIVPGSEEVVNLTMGVPKPVSRPVRP